MGGFGSGRKIDRANSPSLEELFFIDINNLLKDRLDIKIDSSGPLYCHDKYGNSLRFKHEFSSHYHFIKIYSDIHNDIIYLNTISTNYGGFKWCFSCPECEGRYIRLYFYNEHFRCRKCHHLYNSTSKQGSFCRLKTKRRKALDKLEADNYINIKISRPKYMHWKTYNKLMDNAKALDGQLASWMLSELSGLHKGTRNL